MDEPPRKTKSSGAFLTIGEVAAEFGVPQHVLRYWETKFPQLKPVQRAGNRRYYRPQDVLLVRRIQRLLDEEGYTIRGVQKLLAEAAPPAPVTEAAPAPLAQDDDAALRAELHVIRGILAEALADG